MRWLLPLSSSALFWTLLIAGIHRESPRTAVSAHGFLHSAIAQRFQVDGWVIPPQNPFFAGEPLPYYWSFHALGAAVGKLLGLDPLRSFELLIGLATIGLVAGCGWLARALYGNAALGALTAFLILVGANLQAPVVVGVRGWLSDGRVFADSGAYLWGLAHPLLGHMRLWDPFSTLGPLLPFYLNITARPLALSALVFVLLGAHRALSQGWRGSAGLAVAVALCTAFSVLVGLPSAVALGLALVVLRAPALAFFAGHQRPPLAPLLAALAVGIALGATSVLHLFAGTTAAPAIQLVAPGVATTRLLGMLACGWPLLALCVVAISNADDQRRHFLSVLVLTSIALTGGAALLELPAGNHVNLFHAALVMLAVGASGAMLDARNRPSAVRIAWTIALFLPVLALIVMSYTSRPPVPLAFDGRQLRRVDDTHVARLYGWIRAETPSDAVLVIDPDPPIRAMSGNTAELPALTERTLFTARSDHYIVTSHAEAGQRAAIARRLLTAATLSDEDAERIARLGRRVYLVADAAARNIRPAALSARYGPPVFQSGPVQVWRWSHAASLDASNQR